MRVVICGAGIAGLTLAWCLERQGHEPILIEQAEQLRDDGYMMDFFGSGYDASERLGLLPDLAAIHYPIERVVFLDGHGRTQVSLEYAAVRARLFGDRHFNFLRGALERVLYGKLADRTAIRFGATVASFEPHARGIEVRLNDGTVLDGDLLVGADGIHSRIRRLAFGADSAFVHRLGYVAAAYIINTPPPAFRLDGALHVVTAPNRQVSLYPIHGHRAATFFLHHEERSDGPPARPACDVLRERYGDLGWLIPQALSCCPEPHHVYFDDVAQVEMPAWSRQRVALLGDACQCLSPLAGQGASMAMAGAYILAEELERHADDMGAALSCYEHRVKGATIAQQRAARRMAHWFVPSTHLHLMVRDAFACASTWPLISSMIRHRIASESILRA